MLHFSKAKIFSILAVCLFGIFYSLPNLLPANLTTTLQQNLPSWMPTKTVNLGLDLRGGSHLLLQVDVDKVVADRLDSIVNETRRILRQKRVGYQNLRLDGQTVKVTIRDDASVDESIQFLRELGQGIDIESVDDRQLHITFTESKIQETETKAIAQSIEIVRRRIDETGTREPIIQRQGRDRIIVQLPGVDDPSRVKDLLGKTAQLTFHLVETDANLDQARRGRTPPGTKALPFTDQPGRIIVVKRRAIITGDMLTDATATFQQGQPVVSFKFNAVGTRRFARVTQENVGRPFAIVLDNEVISAPNIREPITGGAGVISGGFTTQGAQDLALLLRAGALPAPLKIIEERTVGPSLGADSIQAGKYASIVALGMVLIFMVLIYGIFGWMANVALVVNMALIFAILSALQATLTLPGIAGIVLTIGMAVDANVLIFERIREEVANGRSPLSAVDSGYSNAMSTIIDANLTTLIASLFLYAVGTGPVRGFAVTLSVGIATSMFSAIMVTRILAATWLKRNRPDKLKI